MNLKNAFQYLPESYEIKRWLHLAWLFIRHHPICVCPWCKGRGGEMSRGEESEWMECYGCYHRYHDFERWDFHFKKTRIQPSEWIIAKIAQKCGEWEPVSSRRWFFRRCVTCWIGRHYWTPEGYCGACYASQPSNK